MGLRNKTWLFVPAEERFLSTKADGLADVLIFDLEDSIRDTDKTAARERLSRLLQFAFRSEVYVRINTGETGNEDLRRLNGCRYDGLILPKTDSPGTVLKLAEHAGNKKLIALVESPYGIMNLERIAELPCLYGLAFGGEDYCRELGVETNELAMQYARGKLVLLARCHGKYCLDTISMEYKDDSAFLQKYKESVAMGFHSRLLIHPAQVRAIRTWEEQSMSLDEMRRIVSLFENSSGGLVRIDGRWYEKPHIDRLKNQIAQAETDNARRKR